VADTTTIKPELPTRSQLQAVRTAVSAILGLGIATPEESECLLGMDQRMARWINQSEPQSKGM